MTSKSSDFVLDEGLDDDEDMLAFHTERTRTPPPEETVTAEQDKGDAAPDSEAVQPETPIPVEETPRETKEEPETKSIIIDGLPLTSSRAGLDSFLPSPTSITHIRLRRLETHGLLRVMIEFETAEMASEALLLDGSEFQGSALSIKPGNAERWAAAAPRRAQVQPKQNSLWSSLSAMAERLETEARKIGEDLENKLHVSERVAGTAAAIKEADKTYGVSTKVGEMARAGAETAKGVDRAYGISDGVGRVVENVGSAAKIVASEVDESFRVGDRAREAANSVLKNETFAPVARRVLNGEDGNAKNCQPGGDLSQENVQADAETSGVAENGRIPEAGNKVEVGE